MLRRAVICILLIYLFLLLPQVKAYSLQEVTAEVYRDGVIHVRMSLTVNETEPLVTIELLSSKAYNILILDETGDVLNYDSNGSTLTVYTLGASKVSLEYDADDLTSKSGEIWTLNFVSPYEVTLLLPENSTLIYFNNAPASVGNTGAKIKLELQPGSWEISYILGAAPSTSPSAKPPQSITMTDWLLPLLYLISGVIVVAAIILALKILRRRKELETVKTEEAEVIRFLKEHGGRALEAELRTAFPDIPKTSMWRLIKRLERRGILTVKKVGLQNVVELK